MRRRLEQSRPIGIIIAMEGAEPISTLPVDEAFRCELHAGRRACRRLEQVLKLK